MYKSDSKLMFWPYVLKSIPFWQFMWEEKKVSLGHSSVMLKLEFYPSWITT